MAASLGFLSISPEEYAERMEREAALFADSVMRKRAEAAQHAAVQGAAKRPVGRPRTATVLNSPESMLYGGEGSRSGSRSDGGSGCGDGEGSSIPNPSRSSTSFNGMKRGRGSHYTNWFTFECWPHIENALRQSHWSTSAAVHYLQRRHPATAAGPGLFDRLNESTMRGWFLVDQRTFKTSIRIAIDAIHSEDAPSNSRSIQLGTRRSLWKGREALEDEWQALLRHQRDNGQVINSITTHILLKGFLQTKCPEVLAMNGGPFHCSREYMRKYLQKTMGWTFRQSTTNASKLPRDWNQQGDTLALRLAYLVKAHNIPPTLVVNMDQTGISLVPCSGERTYSKRGAKEISVTERDDKRSVTCVPSLTASGHLLPFQVVFEGKTKIVLLECPTSVLVRHKGWILTQTHNHWSNLNTCIGWVDGILRPWYMQICKEQNRAIGRQKMVLLIDCWSVHKSVDFRTFLTKNYPFISVLFVPAGTTSKFQPCDVIVQRPLKASFQASYHAWATQMIASQFSAGITPMSSRMDYAVSTLRVKAIEFLHKAFCDMSHQTSMLLKGWSKAGLLRAWSAEFQESAFVAQESGELFNTAVVGDTLLEPEPTLGVVHMEWEGETEMSLILESCAGERTLPNLNDAARTIDLMDDRLFDFTSEDNQGPSSFGSYLTDVNVTTLYASQT